MKEMMAPPFSSPQLHHDMERQSVCHDLVRVLVLVITNQPFCSQGILSQLNQVFSQSKANTN